MSEEQFRTLVNEFSSQVLNTAIRVLGDTEGAQDVHQEVFLAIWKRWHKYNGRMNWKAYLYRVTVRKAIDFAKHSKNEEAIKLHPRCCTEAERPDELLWATELKYRLTKLLTRLSKRQADVFVLYMLEGLTAGQIAEIMDCSAGTVRVQLHRAIKRLAPQLRYILSE